MYLDGEKTVLRDLERQYKRALEAINEKIAALLGRGDADMQHVIYRVEHQKALRLQVQAILEQLQANEFETISEYLAKSYEDGFVGAMYGLHQQGMPFIVPIDQEQVVQAIQHDTKLSEDLYTTLGVDVQYLKKVISAEISRGIASGMAYGEIARNVSNLSKAPLSRAKTIARTEAGRIQEQATLDSAFKSKAKGANIMKRWSAVRDGNTRSAHRQLHGQIREIEEPYEYDTKKAMCPHGFGDPALDINCRCTSVIMSRKLIDKELLKQLQDDAKYWELDTTDSIEEFRKRYMKAAKMLETPSETGLRAVPYSKRGIKIEKRLQDYVDELHADGEYIIRNAGSFKAQDLAIMTTETGVEYTTLTIGKQSYLIRGAEKHTTISNELLDMLIESKGTLDCHSHPYVGDLIPSESDMNMLKLLPWQEESVIIEPGQKAMRYNTKGAIGTLSVEEKRVDDYYIFMFGDGE